MTSRLAGRECPALGRWEAGETLAGKELLQGHTLQGQTISPVARGESSWVSGSGWVVTGLAAVTCWPLVSSCLHEGPDLLVFSDLRSLGAQHGHQGHLRCPPHADTAPSLAQQCGGFHPSQARPAGAQIVTDPGKSISNPVRPYLSTSKAFLVRSRRLQVVPFGPMQSQTVIHRMSDLGAVRECDPVL